MTSRDSLSPDLSVADRLDDEIAKLRAQVESLKNELKLQTTTVLASDTTRRILQDDSRDAHGLDASTRSRLLAESDKQVAHQQQSLYRACASITALKIRDPDPNAVDGGNVLGLRFEAMSRSRFIRPYYVMLNRPYAKSQHLRIHRHTVPPSIAVSGLAARHLPAPRPDKDGHETQMQDLPRFARALRRELVRYQNRITTIGDLRRAAGLGSGNAGHPEEGDDTALADISAVDAEAKQVRLEWEDGRIGRLVMDNDGKISKAVVQRENERDRQRVRELLGNSTHIQDLVRRLDVNEPVYATQQMEASAGLPQGRKGSETASEIDPFGLDTLKPPTVPQASDDETPNSGREGHFPPLESEKDSQDGKPVPTESYEDSGVL